MPATPALRREQIKLQVALITPLIHVKGYAAPETMAAVERARLLIEQAEALGEPPEDPLQFFAVLFGFTVANLLAFNGDVSRDLAAQFLELAEKQAASFPRVIGQNFLGCALTVRGDFAQGRAHLDQGIALYDPAEHRSLAMRFGEDQRVANLYWRSKALWALGYPDAARVDVDLALTDERESPISLFFALNGAFVLDIFCGNYTTANARIDELVALSDEKGVVFWKSTGMLGRAWVLRVTGRASDAVRAYASAITAYRSTGATLFAPFFLSHLAKAYADLGQFDDAWRCISEAMSGIEATKERWCEAEVNRIAGEIALMSPKPDAAKAEAYFERALAVARQQQAKSWELRAAMSLARLWRGQGEAAASARTACPGLRMVH